MKKKIIALVLAVTILVGGIVGGTLAYLSDTDSAVNVATVGNVKIKQYQLQRAEGITYNNGGEALELGDLVPYEQGQKLYPAYSSSSNAYTAMSPEGECLKWGPYASINGVSQNSWNGLWKDYDEKTGEGLAGAMDTFVFVENTGKSDAYYRTWVALECPQDTYYSEGTDKEFMNNVNLNWRFEWDNPKYVFIDDTRYCVLLANYTEKLVPGEMSRPSLLQVVMTNNATNAVTEALGDTYDILVYTEAVQVENMPDAKTALNAAFGDPDKGYLPWDAEPETAKKPVLVDTADELVDALKAGNNVALTADIDLGATAARAAADIETVTIPAGANVELNLNGHTLSGTYTKSGVNVEMFLVKGEMTVKNGTINMDATVNQGWSKMSTIFDITAGGVLNVENAQLFNLGGTDMAFVAHLNNWGEATLNVDNSTITSTYCGVRVFNSGYDMNNVTITNSTIVSPKYAFWVHNYTVADFGSAAKAEAQAKLLNFNFVVANPNPNVVTGDASNINAEANNTIIGKICYGFTDEEYFYTPETTTVFNEETLRKAVANGGVVTVAADVEITKTIEVPADKDVTLDLAGYTISGTDTKDMFSLFHVNNGGKMTVVDATGKGKISYDAGTGDETGAAIFVEGALALNSGIVEITGEWYIGFAVDAHPNAWGSKYTEPTTFTMNGGKIVASDSGVRVANYSAANAAVSANFIMKGGEIESVYDAVFVQHVVACPLNVTINGGTMTSGTHAIRVYGNEVNDVNLKVAAGTLNGSLTNLNNNGEGKTAITGGNFSVDPSDFVAVGYMAEANADGTYGIKQGFVWTKPDSFEEENIIKADATVAEILNIFDRGGDIYVSEDYVMPITGVTSIPVNGTVNLYFADDAEFKFGHTAGFTGTGAVNVYGGSLKTNHELYVSGDTTLTIYDGEHTFGAFSASRNGRIVVNGGTLNCMATYAGIMGIAFKENGSLIVNAGKLNMYGPVNLNQDLCDAVYIEINGGTIELLGGIENLFVVRNKLAKDAESGVPRGSSVRINGGTFIAHYEIDSAGDATSFIRNGDGTADTNRVLVAPKFNGADEYNCVVVGGTFYGSWQRADNQRYVNGNYGYSDGLFVENSIAGFVAYGFEITGDATNGYVVDLK